MKFEGKLRMNEYLSFSTSCFSFVGLKWGKDKEFLYEKQSGREIVWTKHYVAEDPTGEKGGILWLPKNSLCVQSSV